MKNDKDYKFGTRAIHGGQDPDPLTGAVMTPIYQTSTYAQSGPGEHKGYEYSRTDNPTRRALEACLASLEMGDFGLAFASGMSAISTLALIFKSGDHFVCSDDIYGGTFRVFDKIFRNLGLEFSFVDTTNTDNIEAMITNNTKLIWLESPTNPTLKITDIAAVSKMAKSKNILVGVDNTFMSPYFQRPLELGADVVMHSTTKYIGGHSDVVGGALVTSDPDLAEKLYFAQNSAGAISGPQDSFLTMRGVKTLHVRMDRHEQNARKVFECLKSQDSVNKIYYPGDPNHPGHEIQKAQASGFGGMISFDIETLDNAKRFLSKLKVFTLAESLGGVESLIEHPAIMTHASVPIETRNELGITDGFIRLSVGIEDIDDLIEDLERGFVAI